MSGPIQNNEWLTVPSASDRIGVELPIGHILGELYDEPVLILKCCIGNRGLGWDLLPPGSESWEGEDRKTGKTYVYAGYQQSPARWEKGTEPQEMGWYAGLQYDDDVNSAKSVLDKLDTYYPGAQGHEVVGFFWWQGDKDMRDPNYYNRYEKHLVALIKSLRKDFEAADAYFVAA